MEIFRDIAISQVPRILGFQDRESDSPTYGCFDRYYWHYRLLDISNSRMQEAGLLMAMLYKNNFTGNRYFNNPLVLEWAEASLRFSNSIQHRNGSFDEVYPNEESFVATSFTLCALAETMLVLQGNKITTSYSGMIDKGGEWLCQNNHPIVLNQMCGASAALCLAYKITGKNKFKDNAENKLATILNLQDPSGYLQEYGGWDIGYLSISIAYLSKICNLGVDISILDDVQSAIGKSIDFVESRVNHDGTYDFSSSSRGTQYIYPSGFATNNSSIIGHLASGLNDNLVLNPTWLDDRFCVPLTIDYLLAYLENYETINDNK